MFKTPYFSLLFWAILVFYPAAAQAQQPDKATLEAWIVKGIEYSENEDYEEAAYWFRKAVEQGNEYVKEALARLEEEKEITKEEIIVDIVLLVGIGALWGYSAYIRAQEKKPLKALAWDFVKIEAGSFTMGCTSEQDTDCYDHEKPAHKVTLTKDYYLGKYPVTQAQWRAVMGSNPSHFKSFLFTNCSDHPVERVSWNDIQEFLAKLNQQAGTKGTSKHYRLPTEAEWEYAARGGNKSKGYKYTGAKGTGSNDIDEVAWYDDNSGSKTHPVGQKAPNELGFYDMSGNVDEWCSDWYGEDYYSGSPETDPKGSSSGRDRVLRGGSWSLHAMGCRVSSRNYDYPGRRLNGYGFRLCLSL